MRVFRKTRPFGRRPRIAVRFYGGFPGDKAVLVLLRVLSLAVGVAVLLLLNRSVVQAELCWYYVDTVNTSAPFVCVQQGDLTTPCSWNPSCHLDGDPSDCCTTVPAPAGTTQTLLDMHFDWHQCFGSIGASDNPPGRGQRWYAFHRQFEHDFNAWREDGHLCDPTAASPAGCKIESIEWCPGVNMPYGHFGAGNALDTCSVDADCSTGQVCRYAGQPEYGNRCFDTCISDADCSSPNECITGICRHPSAIYCAVGPNRPANTTCANCIAFPQCLYVSGGGPSACPSAPSSACEAPGGVSYPYTSLADFPNMEQVTTILDDAFHGDMHGDVGFADGGDYNHDVYYPRCSPRDPMFWRLHKALDDVVRAWQDINATDVMVVVDRSGSMGEPDSSGTTKMAAALDAVDMFADLLEDGRSDGQTNRVGVVSYSTDAADAARNMPLTVADANLRNAGGPLDTVLTNIQTSGPGGWTSIGSGLESALEALCPPSGVCEGYTPPLGENARKSVLLLTDGVENVPACLRSAGPETTPVVPPPAPFDQCFGDQLSRDTTAKLGLTQVCAVGFGDAGSLNGDLLTLFAEGQGGIYMQNPPTDPDGEWIDLKDFFSKCFGQLSDEFVGLDPKGILAVGDPVSEPIEYTSCDDEKITFASGWKDSVAPGDLRLVVTTPSGALVRPGTPSVEDSQESTWHITRVRLPHGGETSGTWRAHLIRPHQVYVNGFTTDSFVDMDEGVALVRRQLQRLCPDGCEGVLYFEDGHIGPRSAYAEALEIELESGLLGVVEQAADAADFTQMLPQGWDVIVYAHQNGTAAEQYDSVLAGLLCEEQRAIVTDTRLETAAAIHECAGVEWNGSLNWSQVIGDRRLVDGTIELTNPGYPVSAYGLAPFDANIQATNEAGSGAIAAKTSPRDSGQQVAHKWFVNVLVRGLSRLDQFKPVSLVKAGDSLLPTVQILPSFNRRGGYDDVNVWVEMERPLVGVGSLLGEEGLHQVREVEGEILSARDATLSDLRVEAGGPFIPTEVFSFTLYDDGTNGDLHPGNGVWSAQLPDPAKVDGMYQYRFVFEATAGSCTTRRELVQSVFVEVQVDPSSSSVDIGAPDPATGVQLVDILPRDHLGNLWGPGRPGSPSCDPASACECDPEDIVDHGDGRYTIPITFAEPDAICLLDAFGARFALNREPAATLTLTPSSAQATVGAEQSFTALVRNEAGDPAPGHTVEFHVSGVNNIPSGSAVTDANGEANFAYTSAVEGTDTVRAWVDLNRDAHQDAGEAADAATINWTRNIVYLPMVVRVKEPAPRASFLRVPVLPPVVLGMLVSGWWLMQRTKR